MMTTLLPIPFHPRATDADIVGAIAEQISADMDKHLIGPRARPFLQQKLRRLEQVYGKAGLRLRQRTDLE
jgi:hypothetical protein